tara:strand:- start:1534 stop:2187 length:654 start_codon:yes stop_codon:yes gene_type:complete
MGFLDNTTITVDAILTKVGRKRLSQGTFNISRYALSDEEVDYNLYDVNHPNGTDSYGTVIENMNLMEAIPNRTGFMSYLVNESLSGAQLILESTNIGPIDGGTIISINPETTGAPAENYSFEIGKKLVVRFKDSFAASVQTGKSAILRAQKFITPSPTNSTTVTVTGLNSGLVGIVNISVNMTPGSTDDSDGPDDKGNGDDNYGGGVPPKGGELGPT